MTKLSFVWRTLSYFNRWNLVWRYATERYSDYHIGRKIKGQFPVEAREIILKLTSKHDSVY